MLISIKDSTANCVSATIAMEANEIIKTANVVVANFEVMENVRVCS